SIEAECRQILYMLRQYEGPAVQHEDALAAVGAAEPEMLGDGAAERAAADDDEVKRPQIAACRQARSGACIRVDRDDHFVEGIADVATEDVTGERREFGHKRHG